MTERTERVLLETGVGVAVVGAHVGDDAEGVVDLEVWWSSFRQSFPLVLKINP